MTTFEPTGPVPDDERLSRHLDGDLDPVEAAALQRDLAADSALRGRLDVLARVVDHVGSLHAEPPAEADGIDFTAMRDRALAAWAGEAPPSPVFDAGEPAAMAAAERRHLAAVAVTPAGRRWRGRRPIVGLSAAAAVVLVAGLALLTDRGSSGDRAEQAIPVAAPATSTYSPQRATAPAAAEAAADATSSRPSVGGQADSSGAADPPAVNDASTSQAAGSTLATDVASLGSFATYEALLDAVRARPLAIPTTSTAPMDRPGGTAACAATHPGSATVDGLAVRWAVQGDGSTASPAVIEVVDAATCDVVTRQAR